MQHHNNRYIVLYPSIKCSMRHLRHQANTWRSFRSATVLFCINETNGDLYCIQNYPHAIFAEDNIDEDIKDPTIKEEIIYTMRKNEENTTYTTIILRLNKFPTWYWWGEIGRECDAPYMIRDTFGCNSSSSFCLNDKLYLLGSRHTSCYTNTQLIRIFDIKKRKFELFCHHINNISETRMSSMKFTIINKRWILIAFRIRKPGRRWYSISAFELIDLKEIKFKKRAQGLPLILPDTFLLKHIYVTINSNNNPESMYKKIVDGFTRNIENIELSLEIYNIQKIPIVLINLINYYYYCSIYQIWLFGTSTTNINGWEESNSLSDKMKNDMLICNYDDLWLDTLHRS